MFSDEDDERGICSFTALPRQKWAQVRVYIAIFCHAVCAYQLWLATLPDPVRYAKGCVRKK